MMPLALTSIPPDAYVDSMKKFTQTIKDVFYSERLFKP